MQEMNGAEILVKSLEDLGVTQIFGYTGAIILPVYHTHLTTSNFALLIVCNNLRLEGQT